MADFIKLGLDVLLDGLVAFTPDLLRASGNQPFREFGTVFTGLAKNPPSLWVMPGKTQFDPEGDGRHQVSHLTVKIAVIGPTPEALSDLALTYVKAVDDAIAQIPLTDNILRVFVEEHDYGPLYEKSQTFARLPEVHVLVETYEL